MGHAPASRDLAALIDHTLLRPNAVRSDIRRLCEEAIANGFAAVCVNPCWVPLAASETAGSTVKVCTVIGFPLGATLSASKIAEAKNALRAGAVEFDMVQNIGALLSGERDVVLSDMQGVVELVHDAGGTVKVILETCLLDQPHKTEACQIALETGADFVKTSTGFAGSGATVEDVRLMRSVVGAKCGVKASGGIRTLADCQAMLEAGANRIGTSSGVRIIQGLLTEPAAAH